MKKNSSTIKQYAYATRRLGGQGKTKKEMAILSGFSPAVAENVKAKVEDTVGYKNAVIELAHKSNNLLLAVMTEFEARGLEDFSNADLTKALNAISSAWDRVEKVRAPDKLKTPEGNRLRGILTQRVETKTITVESIPPDVPASAPEPEAKDAEFTEKPKEADEEIDLDF